MASLFKTLKQGAHDGRWWYSTVHLTTMTIGAGVLGIPSAMVYLGWWGGLSLLFVSYIITLCTLWQIVHLHHLGNERIDRLPDLGAKAFGIPGWYSMFILQMIYLVSVNVVYMITGGYAISLTFTSLQDFKGIIVFAASQYVVCLIPDFSSLTWLSTITTLMSIGYSTLIWGSALHLHGLRPDISYKIPHERRLPRTLNGFGVIGFVYGGQNVALEIQSMIRAPSTEPMWYGVMATYLIVAFCYFPVAGAGYWAFGNLNCYGNILEVLDKPYLPRYIFYAANSFLALHLVGAYQVYALPVYAALGQVTNTNIAARYTYISFTCFIAVLIPFYKNIIALLGGLVIGPMAYFVPCILWLAIKKPEPFSLSWIGNVACIVFGTIVTMMGVVGGLWEIIDGVENGTQTPFHFFQIKNCTLFT